MRRLLEHPRVEPHVAKQLRGRVVRERLRYGWAELVGSHAVRGYHVRATGVPFFVEHNSPDVLVLEEIFGLRLYEPPAAVESFLRSRDGRLRAVDLGGNIGMFGIWLVGRLRVRALTSFEPDARNAAILKRAIAAGAHDGRWELVRAAAATADGTVRFAGGEYATSHVVEHGGAEVPAADVLARLPGTDLLKMDIEGGEWALLADPRFFAARVPVVVLEYHPQGAPAADTHTAAREAFTGAGYTWREIFAAETGVGMAWASLH